MSILLTHIVNPFRTKAHSEHDRAQRVTFGSLREAVRVAEDQGVGVEVLAGVLPGDEGSVEAPASVLAGLKRTVLDVGDFKRPRPLPLIGDLVDLAYRHGVGEYVIYTNIDIAVQPHFYTSVRDLIEQGGGGDFACAINRRQIGDHYRGVEQLPEMYAERGTAHPGIDCFVFPRRFVPELALGDSCIGSIHFDSLLVMNLDALSGFGFRWFRDLYLTFHLGEDRGWVQQIEYMEHNLWAAVGAIEQLKGRFEVPRGSEFARLDTGHFQKHQSLSSYLVRRLKRIPYTARGLDLCKQVLGRTYT